jgi:hypothetical protein
MADEPPKPGARPLFRRVAGGVAVVCFVLAAVFSFAPIAGDMRLVVSGCVAMGVVMAGCACWG